jgi:hypothetical protein
VTVAASPLGHDSAYASNNNGQWIGLLPYWTATRKSRWRLRGVTFDEVFRRGIGGAAQVLSDNGEAGSRE